MAVRYPMRATLPLGPAPDLPEGITVRPLGIEAAEELAALMTVAYAGSVDDHGESPEEFRERARTALDGSAFYGPPIAEATLGAYAPEGLVGAMVATDWAEEGEVLLAFALVAPSHQGRGIGTALLLRSAQALARAGRPDWVLSVTEGNPARRLYQRLGFVDFTPIRRRHRDGEPVSAEEGPVPREAHGPA